MSWVTAAWITAFLYIHKVRTVRKRLTAGARDDTQRLRGHSAIPVAAWGGGRETVIKSFLQPGMFSQQRTLLILKRLLETAESARPSSWRCEGGNGNSMYSVRAAVKNSRLQLTVSLTVYWLYCGPHTVAMGVFAT